MIFDKLIEQLRQFTSETEDANFNKTIGKIISLLEQIEQKNITEEEKAKIQRRISPFLEPIHTKEAAKEGLKQLRKTLNRDFGFVPPNYYFTLGVGIGVALGTSLGISFGVPYENGVVFGPMIGSGIGLVGGLIGGTMMDKKKVAENRTLQNL